MGAGTSSGKASAASVAKTSVATNTGNATQAAQPKGTATQQTALRNFLFNNAAMLNTNTGIQVASNAFQYLGLSNEQAVDIINSISSPNQQYEIHKMQTPGTFWTNGAPTIREYIRRK